MMFVLINFFYFNIFSISISNTRYFCRNKSNWLIDSVKVILMNLVFFYHVFKNENAFNKYEIPNFDISNSCLFVGELEDKLRKDNQQKQVNLKLRKLKGQTDEKINFDV